MTRLLLLLSLAIGCEDESDPSFSPEDELVDPPELSSQNGLLEATLTAGPAEITVAGQSFVSNVYNGTYVPPVLRVRRGDQVRLDIVNRIGAGLGVDGPQPTNLHYHGMTIGPKLPSDDVYLAITPEGGHDGSVHADPGKIFSEHFEYEWTVPSIHPKGEYWYHPHYHGHAEAQVLGGMSGMLIVDGMFDGQYPELASLRERVMYLKDIQLPNASDDDPKTKTINGRTQPVIAMRPGEWQVWRLGNIGADAFFDIAIDGAPLWIVALDGNLMAAPEQRDSVLLVPSGRATVVVGGLEPGTYDLLSREVDTGPMGDPNPRIVLARIIVEGERVDGSEIAARLEQPANAPEEIRPSVPQLSALPITRRRTIVFSETEDGNTFFIDGREFDLHRIDVSVRLGDVEEWTVINQSQELHTFHIHQMDFLVTGFVGEMYDITGVRDVVDVPYQRDSTPGSVTMILPFTDPIIVGKFPFHCHILEHEDGGMMANLEVVAPED